MPTLSPWRLVARASLHPPSAHKYLDGQGQNGSAYNLVVPDALLSSGRGAMRGLAYREELLL